MWLSCLLLGFRKAIELCALGLIQEFGNKQLPFEKASKLASDARGHLDVARRLYLQGEWPGILAVNTSRCWIRICITKAEIHYDDVFFDIPPPGLLASY